MNQLMSTAEAAHMTPQQIAGLADEHQMEIQALRHVHARFWLGERPEGCPHRECQVCEPYRPAPPERSRIIQP